MSSVGKIAMEEVSELFLMTVEINNKLDFSAMIDAPQDMQDLVLTVIKFVPQALEMMDSSAEKLNMEELLAILGNSVMDSKTVE